MAYHKMSRPQSWSQVLSLLATIDHGRGEGFRSSRRVTSGWVLGFRVKAP